jgi:hypothetical protein
VAGAKPAGAIYLGFISIWPHDFSRFVRKVSEKMQVKRENAADIAVYMQL